MTRRKADFCFLGVAYMDSSELDLVAYFAKTLRLWPVLGYPYQNPLLLDFQTVMATMPDVELQVGSSIDPDRSG